MRVPAYIHHHHLVHAPHLHAIASARVHAVVIAAAAEGAHAPDLAGLQEFCTESAVQIAPVQALHAFAVHAHAQIVDAVRMRWITHACLNTRRKRQSEASCGR